MGGSTKADSTYIKQGKTLYDSATTIYGDFYTLYNKLGLFAPKLTLGDPIPIGPQQKDRDSPLSHSTRSFTAQGRAPMGGQLVANKIVF